MYHVTYEHDGVHVLCNIYIYIYIHEDMHVFLIHVNGEICALCNIST